MKRIKIDPIMYALYLFICGLSSSVWVSSVPFHFKLLINSLAILIALIVFLFEYLSHKNLERMKS